MSPARPGRKTTFFDLVRGQEPFAVVDFGSGYAKALVLHFGPVKRWNVVGAATIPYVLEQRSGHTGMASSQLQAGIEAINAATMRSPAMTGRLISPRGCVLVLPDALTQTVLHSWETNREQYFLPVSAIEATQLRQQAILSSLTSFSKERPLPAGDSLFWIGRIWETWRIRNRRVTGTYGFRGKEVTASLAQVFAPSQVVRVLEDWAYSEGLLPILAPEAVWATPMLAKHSSCCLLDCGARRTDIYLHYQDGSYQRLLLPIGGQYFTRALSFAAGISPNRAEKLKLAYAWGRLQQKTRAKVVPAMTQATQAWSRVLANALQATRRPLPDAWITAGGHSELPEVDSLLAMLPDDTISRFKRYPSLARLSADSFCGAIVPGPEPLGRCHHTALSVANQFVHLAQDSSAYEDLSSVARAASEIGFGVADSWLP